MHIPNIFSFVDEKANIPPSVDNQLQKAACFVIITTTMICFLAAPPLAFVAGQVVGAPP